MAEGYWIEHVGCESSKACPAASSVPFRRRSNAGQVRLRRGEEFEAIGFNDGGAMTRPGGARYSRVGWRLLD